MSVSPVVIERPDLQSRPHRILHSVLTFFAWAAWSYLWLPLVTAVAWFVGVRVFIEEMVIPDVTTMVVLFAFYLVVIFAMGGLLVLWARYNRHRFGAHDRRKRVAPEVRPAPPLATGLSEEHLALFREAGSLEVLHAPDGEVLRVRRSVSTREPVLPSMSRPPRRRRALDPVEP